MWADESDSDLDWIHQVSTQTSSFTEESIKSCFSFKDGWSPYQTLRNTELLKLPITSQNSFLKNNNKKPKANEKTPPQSKTQNPTTQAGFHSFTTRFWICGSNDCLTKVKKVSRSYIQLSIYRPLTLCCTIFGKYRKTCGSFSRSCRKLVSF